MDSRDKLYIKAQEEAERTGVGAGAHAVMRIYKRLKDREMAKAYTDVVGELRTSLYGRLERLQKATPVPTDPVACFDEAVKELDL
jgi:hypothetical protein